VTYDAWKLRSDLDDRDRGVNIERCEFCSAPLGEHPWATWSGDGRNVLFCDECADRREREGDA
jgi:hypothetical protein